MEEKNTSIINLGDLTKPATLLIEKISNAIGTIYEPYHVVRLATAQAKANKIKATANIEITELQQRALQRFIAEETRKQKNIEAITSKAIKGLNEDARPQDIEDDWIANFFDRSKLISDGQMQILWSKILAGEANNPGTFSKRTVNNLVSFDKSDAELFTKLCSFCWFVNQEITPLVYSYRYEIYINNQINFDSLLYLDSIGLITFQGFSSGFYQEKLEDIKASYFGTSLNIKTLKKDRTFSIGQVMFTKAGQELATICKSTFIRGFVDLILEQWIELGYVVYCDYPKSI